MLGKIFLQRGGGEGEGTALLPWGGAAFFGIFTAARAATPLRLLITRM